MPLKVQYKNKIEIERLTRIGICFPLWHSSGLARYPDLRLAQANPLSAQMRSTHPIHFVRKDCSLKNCPDATHSSEPARILPNFGHTAEAEGHNSIGFPELLVKSDFEQVPGPAWGSRGVNSVQTPSFERFIAVRECAGGPTSVSAIRPERGNTDGM
jgi:hypothetical protein